MMDAAEIDRALTRIAHEILEKHTALDGLSLVGIRKVIRRPGLDPAIKTKLIQRIPHKQLRGW